MEKYFFTFGIGQTLLANRYVLIEAENYEAAREIMVETFGLLWCWQYAEKEWRDLNIEYNYELVRLNINEFWK